MFSRSMPSLRSLWRRYQVSLRRVRKGGLRFTLVVLLLMVLGDGIIQDNSLGARVTALSREALFDYVSWEKDALWGKVKQTLFGIQPYLNDATRHTLVLDYLTTFSQVQTLETQIERIYANPTLSDPATATAPLRAQRDALRHQLAEDQLLVESIIEEQVSAVLVDEGFTVLGQVLPPVTMHFTQVPTLLIVSPRDRIDYAVDINLNALSIEDRAALETRIDAALDVSSLIVSLGGLSLYPSMVVESSEHDLAHKLARAFEITAHEWVHHYLFFFPLGWEYSVRLETRTINETTATFFGREIARKVMVRYYPELTPPHYPSFLDVPPALADNDSSSLPVPPCGDPDAPEPFDYAQEMHTTRIQVDFWLGQGNVEAAETVMFYQRRKFARNGYAIRKLNQAYFAFYGGYQGAPGAGGTDPTGAAIEELRTLSPDVYAWLRALSDVTTRAELLAALESARGR